MEKNLRFLPPIPEGMRILAGDLEVHGLKHRMDNVRRFASGRDQSIRLEREPNNRHDANAIKIIGVYKGWWFTRSVHIGYVPADVAAAIAEDGLWDKILPRLRHIWVGGFVRLCIVVRFDILAPAVGRRRRQSQ